MTRLTAATIVFCAATAASGEAGLLGSSTPHPAVVRIIAAEGKGVQSAGSGVLVAKSARHGLVVTNWHVVRDATGPVTVIFPDGFRSAAKVLKTDSDWDLAALAIWRPNAEPIGLSAVAPRPGDPLTIAGYGVNGRYREAGGRCTKYYPPSLKLPRELVELSATARQGDSGGPIFNGRRELAGVLFGSGRGYTMGSYCGRVQRFLGTVTDDFRQLPAEETMIARRPPAPAIPARRETPRPPPTQQARVPTVDSGWRASPAPGTVPESAAAPDAEEAPVAATPSGPLGWQDIAGATLAEQIKTVLAAIGVLAILSLSARLLGAQEAK